MADTPILGSPTFGGFVSFVTNVMGLTDPNIIVTNPPDPILQFCYDWAINTVYWLLNCVPSQPSTATVYAIAVYNLGAATLVQYNPDTDTSNGYWATARQNFGLNSFKGGVVNFGSDQSTSTGYAVPDSLKNLTIMDLQLTQTPWGRNYLGIAQQAGPSVWGIT